MPDPDDELIAEALAARAYAYAPYSRFAVGAALRAGSGKVYRGVNVENASYGLTICAERSAIVAAISAGERRIEAIGIAADTSSPVSPCGACRQFIREFGPAIRIIMTNLEGTREDLSIAELLPRAFDVRDLEAKPRSDA